MVFEIESQSPAALGGVSVCVELVSHSPSLQQYRGTRSRVGKRIASEDGYVQASGCMLAPQDSK